jgi:hypothetical protein
LRQHERPHAKIALGPKVERQEQNACRDQACGGKKGNVSERDPAAAMCEG